MNLQHHLDAGSLAFVDVLSEVQPPSTVVSGKQSVSVNTNLRVLLDRVQAYLDRAQSEDSPLIILDDITMLEWIGFAALDINRFFRALRSVCLKVRQSIHWIYFQNQFTSAYRLMRLCSFVTIS